MQVLIDSGVKPEEVGFQLAYSKQNLKKIVRDYPGKEVKKGVERMYKELRKVREVACGIAVFG